MDALKDTANLLGWMLPDDPRASTLCRRSGLCKVDQLELRDVGVLNAQWNTSFESLAT
jgi:hypothetical protein